MGDEGDIRLINPTAMIKRTFLIRIPTHKFHFKLALCAVYKKNFSLVGWQMKHIQPHYGKKETPHTIFFCTEKEWK